MRVAILGDVHVEIPATADPAEIGPVDVVVFTVKSTDTDEAAGRLAPLLGEDTAVISFQNGPSPASSITPADRPGSSSVSWTGTRRWRPRRASPWATMSSRRRCGWRTA